MKNLTQMDKKDTQCNGRTATPFVPQLYYSFLKLIRRLIDSFILDIFIFLSYFLKV